MAWAAVSALKKCRHIDGNADIGITIWNAVYDRFHWVGATGCLPGRRLEHNGSASFRVC